MFNDFFLRLYKSLHYKKKFSIKDKIFFFKELAHLLQWWVSIIQALTLIKKSTKNYCVKEICDNIYWSLKKWENVSRSISRLPKYFNEADVHILKSWENSGEFVNVLKYLSEEYQYLYTLRNKIIWAFFYPAFLFLASIVAIIVLFKFVLPGVISIVYQFQNADFSFFTQLLISLIDFFELYFAHILIILFLIIFWIVLFLSVEEWKAWFDRKVFSFPLVWKILKYYFLVKFLRYFKLFMRAWMWYVDMLYSLKGIMSNRVYKDMISQMIEDTRQGKWILEAFESHEIIIPQEVSVLGKVWEETASLESSVDVAITLYEDEFNSIIDNLSKIIEPVLLIFVGFVVAFVALSIFSIITSILDSLQAWM